MLFRSTAEASVAGYALSGKTTGLQLGKADTGAALADNTTDKSESFNVRTTTAHVRSERLVLAQLPITEPIGAGTAEQTQLTLDGMVLNVDGFGTQEQKVAKYRDLVPRNFRAGLKLFYREDSGLMSPREVVALRPRPDLVVYE